MRRAWSHHLLSTRLAVLVLVVAAVCAALVAGTPGAHAAPPPSLTVTGYAAPGNTLHLDGERFIPGETATLYYDATVIATVPVVQKMSIIGTYVGGFWYSYTVPTSTTTGTHTLKAVAQPSGLTAQTTITVKANWAQYGFGSANTRFNPYETAINASNVSQLSLAWTYSDPNTTYPLSTPSVADGSIYFTSIGDNGTHALDASTGATIWNVTSSNFPTGTGEPAIASGTVFTTGYYLYAMAAGSGVTKWYGNTTYITQPAPTVADAHVYVTDADLLLVFPAGGCGHFECLPSWTYTDAGHTVGNIPAVANGSVYVATAGNLTVLDASSGQLQWKGTLASGPAGSPAVDGGMAFITVLNANYTATLYAFSASGCGSATCSPVWSGTLSVSPYQPGPGNLAVGDGTVFVSSTDGNLYAFAAGGCGSATCSPLWKGQTNGMIESSPAVANGVVYVGSDDYHLYAFNASSCGSATCQPLWSYGFGNDKVQGSPIVVNGMVYVAPYGITLYAFHPGTTAGPREGSSAPSVVGSLAATRPGGADTGAARPPAAARSRGRRW